MNDCLCSLLSHFKVRKHVFNTNILKDNKKNQVIKMWESTVKVNKERCQSAEAFGYASLSQLKFNEISD